MTRGNYNTVTDYLLTFAILLLLLLSVSQFLCIGSIKTMQNYSKFNSAIRVGLEESEVRQILGEPDSVWTEESQIDTRSFYPDLHTPMQHKILVYQTERNFPNGCRAYVFVDEQGTIVTVVFVYT